MFAFFVVSFLLYAWDMRVIHEKREEFQDTPARRELYEHIFRRQRIEFTFLLPAAIVIHGFILVVLWRSPDLILGSNRHIFLVSLQALVGLGYLISTIRSFSRRSALLTACIEEQPDQAGSR